jgi:Holliday junction resolvasome RuvABC ATP-dependent DNA helicase subunit
VSSGPSAKGLGNAPQTLSLASIVGQEPTIQRLKEFAALYSRSGKAPAHVLLTGTEGIGRRTIARAFAAEYCHKYTETNARSLGRPGDLMGILTNLGDGDALLLADIPRIPKNLINFLVPSLKEFGCDFVVDKGIFAKTVRVPLKRFTCLATARSKAECPPELIEAFPLILSVQGYSQTELVSICEQIVQRKGFAITPAAAALVAGASAGTPHHIEVLVDRLVELGRTTISAEDVAQVSSVLGLSTGTAGPVALGGIDTLSGAGFEKVVAALLRAMGFHTEITETTGDGGIDIVATLDRPLIGGRYLIQCKRFAVDKLVGAATVRDFYGAVTADRRAVKGILITTSGFTSHALAFAQQLPIELIGGEELRALLAQHGISTESQSAPGTLFG